MLLICGAGRDVGLQLASEFRRFAPELTVHSTAETGQLAPARWGGHPPRFQVEITSKERLKSAFDGYERKSSVTCASMRLASIATLVLSWTRR